MTRNTSHSISSWLDTTQVSSIDMTQDPSLDTTQEHSTCIPPQYMRTYIGLDTTQCPDFIPHKSITWYNTIFWLDTTQVLDLIPHKSLTWYNTSFWLDTTQVWRMTPDVVHLTLPLSEGDILCFTKNFLPYQAYLESISTSPLIATFHKFAICSSVAM